MAAIILPKTYGLSKPPKFAGVNWAHPLAQGLAFCVPFSEGGGVPRNLVRDVVVAAVGTTSWVASAGGVAGSLATGGNYWDYGQNDKLRLPSTSCTVAVIRRKQDTTARASGLFGVNGSGLTDRIGAHVPYSDGTVYWDFGGAAGANRLTWAGYTPSTAVEYWTFVAGLRGSSLWLNGIQRATQIVPLTRIPDTFNFYVGAGNDLATGDSVDLYQLLVLNTEWDQAQIRQWMVDPYGMLQPARFTRLLAPFRAAVIPLPVAADLVTLDYDYWGEPKIVVPAKLAVDTTKLDHEMYGEPIAVGAVGGVIPGVTLTATANVITVTAPIAALKATFAVLTNTITVTAPAVQLVGHRKYPLPRLELADWLFSQGSERHALPAFVAFQDVADIP